MVALEDAAGGGVEVAVAEVVREFGVVLQDHCEVALDQFQALDDAVGFVEAGFGEDEHHEGVEQFFVLHQLHVALGQFRTQLVDLTFVHFAKEDGEEAAVVGEVFPHDTSIIGQEGLAFLPQLRVYSVEQLLVFAVEEHPRPL